MGKDIITKRAKQQNKIVKLVDQQFEGGSPKDPHKTFETIKNKMLQEDIYNSENLSYMKQYFSDKMYNTPDLEQVDIDTEK